MGSRGALKNIASKGSSASGLYGWNFRWQMAPGKEKDRIFKVELPDKSGTSYPGA